MYRLLSTVSIIACFYGYRLIPISIKEMLLTRTQVFLSFLSGFNQTSIFCPDFNKTPQKKISNICPVVAALLMQHIEDALCHYSTVYVARSSPTEYGVTAGSTDYPPTYLALRVLILLRVV